MTQKAESAPIGDHQSRTRGKLACNAQAPNHADSAGCSASRPRLAGPRRCRCGRGYIGREGWSPDGGRSFREIVRQQWNFSPPKTIREMEEYQVELSDVTILELVIVP